jgi:hypothetical protein
MAKKADEDVAGGGGSMTCGECRHAEPVILGDEPAVECRRYPAQIFVAEGEVLQAWPNVQIGDWCSEFTPSDPAASSGEGKG